MVRRNWLRRNSYLCSNMGYIGISEELQVFLGKLAMKNHFFFFFFLNQRKIRKN